MFVVDAGDLSWKSKTLGTSRLAQQREKAKVQHDALLKGGIDGMVPGDGDLALGSNWLAQQAEDKGLPFVAANLVCDGEALFPGARRVERDGVSLVIAGVVEEGLTIGGCEAGSPIAGLKAALAEQGEADLVVVLAHQAPDGDGALAEAVPAVDIVVNGGAGAQYATPRSLPGDALQLASGSRGKKLGVAAIDLNPGAQGFALDSERAVLAERIERAERRIEFAKKREAEAEDDAGRGRAAKQIAHYEEQLAEYRAELQAATGPDDSPRHDLKHELVGLGESVADDPEVLALLDAAKDRIEIAAQAGARVNSYNGPYVGSAACEGCHAGPAAQWKSTAHAKAWPTLVAENRENDLDCFTCHVTGAHDPEGPQHPAQVDKLENVGCESCHGPGREHVSKPGEVDMVASPDEAVCTSCHDGDKDGGRFDHAAYLPKVSHDADGGTP